MGVVSPQGVQFQEGLSRSFWDIVDFLVASSPVVIDRPKGTAHPRYSEWIYPLDYGYLEGTRALDGGGLDVWVGSRPERIPDALVFTLDLKKRDAEVKILLGCTEPEKQVIFDFHNEHSMRGLLVRREAGDLSFLRSRRSVRRFLSQPVPLRTLERILEAATWAPSSHNRQPWRFAALTTEQVRARLAGAMGADFRRDLLADGLSPQEAEAQVERSRRRILDAPVAILLCLDATDLDSYPDESRQQAEYLMGVQSLAMAGENLLLAAHAEGLGGVWVCAPLFAPEPVRLSLELPGNWEPQGLILLGYPAKIPDPRPRKPLAEVALILD